MWKVRSAKEFYKNGANEERETLSIDIEWDIDFESRLEALCFVICNRHKKALHNEDVSMIYQENGNVKVEIFSYKNFCEAAGYYYYYVEKAE